MARLYRPFVRRSSSHLDGCDSLLEIVGAGQVVSGADGLFVQRQQAVAERADPVLQLAEAVGAPLQLHGSCPQLRPLLDHSCGGYGEVRNFNIVRWDRTVTNSFVMNIIAR